MDNKEIWKQFPQDLYTLNCIKPIYEVSNTGKVRNIKTKRVLALTPCNGNPNYLKVQVQSIWNIGLSFRISHVVYQAFVGECYDKRVYHIDGNPRNNSVENLSL